MSGLISALGECVCAVGNVERHFGLGIRIRVLGRLSSFAIAANGLIGSIDLCVMFVLHLAVLLSWRKQRRGRRQLAV